MRRTRCEQQQHQQQLQQNVNAAGQSMLMITDRQHGSTLIANNQHPSLPGKTGPGHSSNSSNNGGYSNYNTLIAWGIPALMTVAVLVSRFVDADELLGEIDTRCPLCYQDLCLLGPPPPPREVHPLALRLSDGWPLVCVKGAAQWMAFEDKL